MPDRGKRKKNEPTTDTTKDQDSGKTTAKNAADGKKPIPSKKITKPKETRGGGYTVKKIPIPPEYEAEIFPDESIEQTVDETVGENNSDEAIVRRTFRDAMPLRLGEKLFRVRMFFGFSQTHLNLVVSPFPRHSDRARIAQYENNTRFPSLIEVLRYARLAGVTMEVLVDDELDLPNHFPSYKDCLTETE